MNQWSSKSHNLQTIATLSMISALFISGCFAPRVVDQSNETAECKLVTRELTLDMNDDISAFGNAAIDLSLRCGEPECLLIIPAGIISVPIGSFIVSGSIVAGGNTIHWLEKQGKCDDSVTQKVVADIQEKTTLMGGIIFKSCSEFYNWLEQKLGNPVEE
ncbi:MAG: hypothetical protein KKE17_15575 [Proteobacteria bacterium]|nr:hypothetical protein [Pseudomonadota bacterium]MBU1711418.1 hypothetical protein [Pseudomonadota bacterium]